VHSYNVLLHLCSGGNQAEDATTRIFAEQAAEARCTRLQNGGSIDAERSRSLCMRSSVFAGI
jgi:hypothetical protein